MPRDIIPACVIRSGLSLAISSVYLFIYLLPGIKKKKERCEYKEHPSEHCEIFALGTSSVWESRGMKEWPAL